MELHFSSLYISTSLLFALFISTANAAGDGGAARDTAALSLFRSQTDSHGALLDNWTITAAAPTACDAGWSGVRCTNRRVTAVVLPSLSLRGPISALSPLDQLRLLDLRDNRLNGDLAALSKCINLKLVYLSGNDFSGEIPPDFASLRRLLRLDLSNNNLRGPLPQNLNKLSRLLTLKLQDNEISGNIPKPLESLPNLRELNLSNNELNGTLPESLLSRYGTNSFSGNEALCHNVTNCPSSAAPNPTIPPPSTKKHYNKMKKGALISLTILISILLLVLSCLMVVHCCRKSTTDPNSLAVASEGGKRSSYSSLKGVDNNSADAGGKSRLVFFYQENQFELEDLLRASAEVIGKGTLGTVYRAVLEGGSMVAVKRLKDMNACDRKEFEQYMDLIGKLRHPNVVRLRAYCYAREEKLLVYDYMPNGSLHSLLHENRGPSRVPLDWTTRISLILGAARGLARIHDNHVGPQVPHGGVQSTNVLLDKNGVASISDFGLPLLLSPARLISRLGGYKAPEHAETKALSREADVYAFGVLLLEVLTGRAPSRPTQPDQAEEEPTVDLPGWVRSMVREEWTAEVFDQELSRYKHIEEELVSVLHVAMACVVARPDRRPNMREVVRMIEEIQVAQSPLGEDYNESRGSISP